MNNILLLVSLLVISCAPPSNGKNGTNGAPGKDGKNGTNGAGCSVLQVAPGDSVLIDGGAVIQCADTRAVISNGHDGLNGVDASYTIASILDPCGDAPNIYDEVFLKLGNGIILWLLVDDASGKNARLSIAQPGTWTTTDGDNCTFTLTSDGRIINENHTY